MENQIFNWFVKKGNIQIKKNENTISLQLDYEGGECCALTNSDTGEIIELLTNLAKQIWESPNYVRLPYTNLLFQEIDSVYVWMINTTQFCITFNETERTIEINSVGKKSLDIEINHMVEIIQILERLKTNYT